MLGDKSARNERTCRRHGNPFRRCKKNRHLLADVGHEWNAPLRHGRSTGIPTGNVTGITIGNSTLTGSFYAATMYGGVPNAADPTTGNGTMPLTGESNGNSTIIVQNDAEAGLPSNFVGPAQLFRSSPRAAR